MEKSYLGFENDRDPSLAGSRKKAKNLIAELNRACKQFVQNDLKEELEKLIDLELPHGEWTLEVDQHDKDGQTLNFFYPTENHKTSAYVRPSVKIEVGARADHWLVEMRMISSYIAQGVPQGITNKECEVRVLSIERTF